MNLMGCYGSGSHCKPLHSPTHRYAGSDIFHRQATRRGTPDKLRYVCILIVSPRAGVLEEDRLVTHGFDCGDIDEALEDIVVLSRTAGQRINSIVNVLYMGGVAVAALYVLICTIMCGFVYVTVGTDVLGICSPAPQIGSQQIPFRSRKLIEASARYVIECGTVRVSEVNPVAGGADDAPVLTQLEGGSWVARVAADR
jgi:hypothetical protein